MGERAEEYGVLVGKLKEWNNLENPGVDGTKRLKCTLKK
jgi:LysM repeat protein